MNERFIEEKDRGSEIILVELGKPFNPFEKVRGFPPIDLVIYPQTVFAMRFKFGEVVGSIKLQTADPEILEGRITPLGKVMYAKEFQDGEERIEEMPLTILSELDLRAVEDFETLKCYSIEFVLGGEFFYIKFLDDQDLLLIRRGGGKEVVQFETIDVNGKRVNLLLPMNPQMLTQVEARIIERTDKS